MLSGIKPGELDVLLTFESYSTSANSIGENIPAFTSYKQMFGKRRWQPSSESFEASQLVGSDQVEYLVRYDAGITNTMRFKQESETTYFYVTNVRSSRREGITIVNAERRDNQ